MGLGLRSEKAENIGEAEHWRSKERKRHKNRSREKQKRRNTKSIETKKQGSTGTYFLEDAQNGKNIILKTDSTPLYMPYLACICSTSICRSFVSFLKVSPASLKSTDTQHHTTAMVWISALLNSILSSPMSNINTVGWWGQKKKSKSPGNWTCFGILL